MRRLGLVLLFCLPAMAGWQRVVMSGKGEFTDTPPAHPLTYFTEHPFLRDDGNDLCVDCSSEAGKSRSAERYVITTEVRPVGVVAGFRVVDVLYRVVPKEYPANREFGWKSVLVQAGQHDYREIFHLQSPHAVSNSQIVNTPREPVLLTSDADGGNGGGCYERYWWFDSNGPHTIDFSKVTTAIAKRLPKGARFEVGCSTLDFASQTVTSGVQKGDAECHACGGLGTVIAHFRLRGNLAEAAEIDFTPAPGAGK